MTISVVIADDHALLREGLASLVSEQVDMQVLAQAGDGIEALERCRELAPDVLVLDLTMPRLGGLEAMARLAGTCPDTRVLVLSMHDDAQHLREALDAGAAGYLVKTVAAREIVHAIREVARGRAAIHVSLGGGSLQRATGARPERPARRQLSVLSERELEVFRQLAYGHTSKEIGAALGLSPKSIDSYRERIYDKLELHGRAALVRYALETGVLTANAAPADDDA